MCILMAQVYVCIKYERFMFKPMAMRGCTGDGNANNDNDNARKAKYDYVSPLVLCQMNQKVMTKIKLRTHCITTILDLCYLAINM